MAWLFTHPRSKNWYIGWRVGSKLFNKSTGLTNRKQAEKLLATYNLLNEANRQKRLTEDFYYSLIDQDPPRTTLKERAHFYIKTFKGRSTPGTHVRYKLVIDRFCQYLHASDKAPLLSDVSAEAAQQFLNGVKEASSAATANFYIKVLKAFFNDAVSNKKLAENPIGAVKFYEATTEELEGRRRPFSEAELQDLYAAAPDAFWRFAIVLGFYTGMRFGNIVTLRWRNLNLDKQVITTIGNKDGDKLQIPLCSPFLLKSIVELRRRSRNHKPDDFLFPKQAGAYLTKSKHGENSTAVFSAKFRSILVAAGLAGKYERKDQGNGRNCRRATSPLSFHSLRHNFITTLKATGAPQMVAREVVGHDSDEVSALYTHTDVEMVRGALKKLPEVFE